jgi:hypothetical protein
MSIFRRRERTPADAPVQPPMAFAITAQDLEALERLTSHARVQLLRLSDSDPGTVDSASGSRMMPLLHQRAGAARVLGHSGIPMLVTEVGDVQAAVLNLESYEGAPMALVEGYELLNRVTLLAELARAAQEIGGVVTLPDETTGTTLAHN